MSCYLVGQSGRHAEHLPLVLLVPLVCIRDRLRVLHILDFGLLEVIVQRNCLRFLDQFRHLCLFTIVHVNGLA